MKYTRRELEIMRERYPTGGYEGVRRKLRNRSSGAIHALAYRMGIVAAPPKWTAEEDATLSEHYPTLGPQETTPLLPGRTHDAVVNRAYSLGIMYLGVEVTRPQTDPSVRAVWTAEEDRIVVENYPTMGAKRTAALLSDRTHLAVRARASDLGIKMDRKMIRRVRYVDVPSAMEAA